MTSAVGSSAVASLEGQMRQAQSQLTDWTTCVSAKTTKGQAEIQKLSGQVSADREQIARAQQAQPAATVKSPAAPTRPGGVDVWA